MPAAGDATREVADGPRATPWKAELGGKCSVSLNGAGDVAVVDGPRVSFWAADGSLRKQGLGFWGQHIYAARFSTDQDIRLFGVSGDYAVLMDARSGTWKPDGAWERPGYIFEERVPRQYLAVGGKRFALLAVMLGDPARTGRPQVLTEGFEASKRGFPGYLFVRLDERRMVPVLPHLQPPVGWHPGHLQRSRWRRTHRR